MTVILPYGQGIWQIEIIMETLELFLVRLQKHGPPPFESPTKQGPSSAGKVK
jgi:hypothetical protein